MVYYNIFVWGIFSLNHNKPDIAYKTLIIHGKWKSSSILLSYSAELTDVYGYFRTIQFSLYVNKCLLSIHQMSGMTSGCIGAYQQAIDSTCDTVDGSIKVRVHSRDDDLMIRFIIFLEVLRELWKLFWACFNTFLWSRCADTFSLYSWRAQIVLG